MDTTDTVGPNAVLAFKRAGYRLTDVSVGDLASTLGYPGCWRMLAQNAGSALSGLTASAPKGAYLKRVHKYCSRIQPGDLTPDPAGAQAAAPSGKIMDDFLFVRIKRCLHVGNAPSPAATAATAAIPIANHIATLRHQAYPWEEEKRLLALGR